MVKNKEICFNSDTLLISTIVVIIVVVAIGIAVIYVVTQVPQPVLQPVPQPAPQPVPQPVPSSQQRFLNNSYERASRNQELIFDNSNANKVGYLFNGSGEQYPLFQFMENREYRYFILDDTRNGNKIDIPNPNKRDVLYDGDKVVVPEFLGELSVKIYPITNTIFSSRI